jgi:predicted Zn-dependent protease with MMP-like domain
MMPKEKFERLVEEALDSLPRRFRQRLHNLAVIVEPWPPQEAQGRLLLGLYHGVPFPHRGPFYGNVSPDVVIIYQGPIESLCSSDEEIEEKVREVVLHEIGHYFGLSESQLSQLSRERNKNSAQGKARLVKKIKKLTELKINDS